MPRAKNLVAQQGKFNVLKLRPVKAIVISGKGNPYENEAFSASVEAIVGLARRLNRGQVLLECIYKTAENEFDFAEKERWQWQLLAQTRATAAGLRKAAVGDLEKKAKIVNLNEGLVVQTLHKGPFTAEIEAFRPLLKFIYEQGYQPKGGLHEIYLSDPSKVKPDDLQTVVRRQIGKR